MANARDAATSGGFTAATSHTFAHTTGSGANRILWVMAWGGIGVAQDITGVTYNGVAMTKICEVVNLASHRNSSLWGLLAPASGTHNVVITGTGVATDACGGSAASYDGAAQTLTVDSFSVIDAASVTTLTMTTTVVAANCWLVAGVRNSGGAVTAGANTSIFQSDADGTNIADSNGTVATGSRSLIVDDAGGGNMIGLLVSFAPAGGGGGGGGKSTPYYSQQQQLMQAA